MLRAAGNAVATAVLVSICFRSSTPAYARAAMSIQRSPLPWLRLLQSPSSGRRPPVSRQTSTVVKQKKTALTIPLRWLCVTIGRYLNLRAISARVNVASQETLRDVFTDPPCSSPHSLSAGPLRPTGSPNTPQSIPAPIRKITRARAVERPFLLGDLCHGVCPMVPQTQKIRYGLH
jgi:hypothetical protein